MPSADDELAKRILAKIADKKILSEHGVIKLLDLLTKNGTSASDWTILAQNEIKPPERDTKNENS